MADLLAAFIRVASYDRPSLEDERDEPKYIVPADDVDEANALNERWGREYDIRNVSASLVVDPDGIIRSFEGRFKAAYEGGTNHLLESEFGVSDIGETNLPEPDWVETARERAPVLTVEVLSNNSGLAITHETGQEIPSDTKVALASPDWTRYETTLESTLSAGETRYVWVTESDVNVSTSKPSTDTRELTREWHLKMGLSGGVYIEKGLDLVI